jgi:hypothetical protein
LSIDQPSAAPHPPTRLTKRFIERLSFDGKPYVVRDTGVRGLLLAVNAHSRSWKVQRDMRTGVPGRPVKTVRHTLGSVDELTIDEARSRAQEVIAAIKRGVDPNHPTAPAPAPAAVWTVQRMFDEYAADLGLRQKADRTIADLRRLLGYLDDWRTLPVTGVTRGMARERHAHISKANGPVVANQALRAFRTCFNFAARAQDERLGDNPVDAVTFHPERSANRSIAIPDLPGWYAKALKLPNPLRSAMHELGLFSGLRPGNLVALERAWINLERRAIVIPADRMKARREFALPLSEHLIGIVRRALAISDTLYPGSVWLFPTRDRDGHVVETQVWKEKTLPGETGHMLRHTYSNVARLAGVDDVDRELLLAHKIPGVQGVYLDTPTLFTRLLEQQERVSRHLLGLVKP